MDVFKSLLLPHLILDGSPCVRYYFHIGSLDGFERKLEDAQIELGIPSGDQVSVKFMQEGSLTAALFELLPTLMLIGATYW